ncbi:unnamed protein product [Cunninghamella blakesleeana]
MRDNNNNTTLFEDEQYNEYHPSSSTSMKRITMESWKDIPSLMISPETKYNVVTVASYMTMGTITVIAVSTVFCLFFFVSMMENTIQYTTQKLLGLTKHRLRLDWPHMVGKLSEQLTYIAEWEKQKRTNWYKQHHHQYNRQQQSNHYQRNSFHYQQQQQQDDSLHDFLFSITGYLNDYVHTHTQKQSTSA